jgi:tocopherol O-methyltransferase
MITPQVTVLNSASVAAHYDDLDPFYRRVWSHHIHHGYWITGKESVEQAALNLTHLVARQAGMDAGTRVCDFGCGYGARVIAMTVSQRQYEFASSQCEGASNPSFLLSDGLDNRLEAGSFDSLVAIESSEHLQDKPAFFVEAFRLLRFGGRAVIAAWLSRDEPRPWEKKYLLEPICAEARLPSMASAREYVMMLTQAGFHEINFQDLTVQVQKTWSLCALRFVHAILTEPSLRRRLFEPGFSNRIFAKTVPRIWLAYRCGSMRYGLFSAFK